MYVYDKYFAGDTNEAITYKVALNRGDWSLAIAEAIKIGICDSRKLTDLIFNKIHPERSGRPLNRSEPNYRKLIVEWKFYRSSFVLPQLAGICCHPYQAAFKRAAIVAKVPPSWATDPALCQLIKHESRWKPKLKNRTSGAFGLFQMLKSTWKKMLPKVAYGSVDPFWQAVGGFRYIKKAYRTPLRAWNFWKATVNKNPALAPKGLQRKAKYWIKKGFAGY